MVLQTEANTLIADGSLGIAKLRFLPKTTSLRPIVNMRTGQKVSMQPRAQAKIIQ